MDKYRQWRLETLLDATVKPSDIQERIELYLQLNHYVAYDIFCHRAETERPIIDWIDKNSVDDLRTIIKNEEFHLDMVFSHNVSCWECLEVFITELGQVPNITVPLSEFTPIRMEQALNCGFDIDDLWCDALTDVPDNIYAVIDLLKDRGYPVQKNFITLLCKDIAEPIFNENFDSYSYFDSLRIDMLKLAIHWGYNPFIDGNLFREYNKLNVDNIEIHDLKSYIDNMIAERNSMYRIFNIWDTFEERQVIYDVMMYQSIIPGLNLLPIELMQMIFGYMRYYTVN